MLWLVSRKNKKIVNSIKKPKWHIFDYKSIRGAKLSTHGCLI